MTRASLRALVRLYRRQVDGAVDEIRRLLVDERDALAALLAVPCRELPTSTEALVALLEARDEGKADSKRERAEHLALRLAGGCRYTLSGIAMPLAWLDELALTGGFDVLAFRFGDDEAHGVDRRLLVATLRELRSVSIDHAEIASHATLRLAYQGRAQRGVLSLHLNESTRGRSAVIVDLGTLLPCHEPVHEPFDPNDRRRTTMFAPLAAHGAAS